MALSKLTLSIDNEIILKVKQIAKQRHVSVSAIFSQYILAMENMNQDEKTNFPNTNRALQLAKGVPKLAKDWNYRDELDGILTEKYDVK